MKAIDTNVSTNLGLLAARAPVGAFFAIAGATLVMDGVGRFVSQNASFMPAVLPDPLGSTLLYALPFLSIAAGVMIVFGFFTRIAALMASAILIGIMVLATGVLSHGTEPVPTSVLLLGVALLLTFVGGGGMTLDHMIWGKRKSAPSKE